MEAKTIKISVLCCLLAEKFNVLLKCLLRYTNLIVYPQYMGSAIQTTVKANKLSSFMPVCIHGFHNDVMKCMLKIDESTIHRNFVTSKQYFYI